MNQITITPKPPYTYKIETSTDKTLIINPTKQNTQKNEIDPEKTTIIVTIKEATQTPNLYKETPIITTNILSNKIENKNRVIELVENEEHWIDNETQITILPKGNLYLQIATIEITYLYHPPKPSTTLVYTDIILLTQKTNKQHIVEANIHPQLILNPQHEPIIVKRHLASLFIEKIKENK